MIAHQKLDGDSSQSDEGMTSQWDFGRVNNPSMKKECILTLDDGGTRGIVSLLVLKTLMEHIKDCERQLNNLQQSERSETIGALTIIGLPDDRDIHPSPIPTQLSQVSTAGPESVFAPILPILNDLPRPCEYFDIIVGAGTGG